MNKLLIVDDSSLIRRELTKLLSEAGFEISTAKDGKEALDLVLTNDFDVITMDINMPIMDGLDLIENINKLYPGIQVIVMSAHTEAEYIQKAHDLGVKDYLIKPFDFIKFIELVASMD